MYYDNKLIVLKIYKCVLLTKAFNIYYLCFVFSGALRTLQKSSEWGQEIRQVLNNGLTRPRNGKDCGDHPPITPTMLASRNELDGDSWKLYDFIVRHFVATISRDCRYYSKTVTFKIGTETFTYNWRTLIDAGFTAITPWKALPKNELAVNFERDEKLNIKDVRKQIICKYKYKLVAIVL